MAIKVEVSEGEGGREYPWIGFGNVSGTIVLFIKDGTGLDIGGSGNVGSYFDGWDMSAFTAFTGSITLSNE